MDRRSFLAAAAGLAWTATAAAAPKRRYITSDTASLRRVLLHPPYLGEWNTVPSDDATQAILPRGPLGAEGAAQHARLTELLSSAHAEVVLFVHVLDEAIGYSRDAGQFGDWVLGTLPWLAGVEDQLTGAYLASAAGPPIGEEVEDEPPPPPQPLRMMFFTRDFGVMTPRGLLVGNFINQDRAPEPALLRFALEWAPSLRRYPVAFDAIASRVFVQGGDVMVLDDKTLLLGVGNLSEEAAAPRLARALGMDVVTVQLPGAADRRSRSAEHRPHGDEQHAKGGQPNPREHKGRSDPERKAQSGPDRKPVGPGRRSKGDHRTGGITLRGWDGLRTLFLHLDTVLGLLNRRSVVTLPYVFEAKYAADEPLRQLAEGFGRLPGGEKIDVRRATRVLAEVGRVRRFLAGSGVVDPSVTGMKIVDYLRAADYEPIFVGGAPPDTIDRDHLRERVLPELNNQAANVVALSPGSVVAYEGNEHTVRAVRAAGIDVATLPGSALAVCHGGPHCLTLPLERG